jgi:BirA family transcriptional regulator, biotin operon repressor / biotin---[acetyl-CoA-carboxylase] ligase
VSEFLDRELFERLRLERGVTWGRPLRLFDVTTSTNDRASEALSSGMKTGGIFVAREQSQGRGRQGASWQSPAGENLTFSVVLRFPRSKAPIQSFPLVVGLALYDALVSHVPSGTHLGIKWPNDVYLEHKKLAGILVEGRSDADEHALVVGVGLNVDTVEFGSENDRRTSLCREGLKAACPSPEAGSPPSFQKESLLIDILAALEARTREFATAGFERCARAMGGRDELLGRHLRVGQLEGQGAGIDTDGALLVAPGGGALPVRVTSGSVELLCPEPQVAKKGDP